MVDNEVLLVVLDVWQEPGEVEATEVEEQAAEGERWGCLEQMEGYEAGEMATGRLGEVSRLSQAACGCVPLLQ